MSETPAIRFPITTAGVMSALNPVITSTTPNTSDTPFDIQKADCLIFFRVATSSSSFIKKEVKTGLMTKATNNELLKTIIKVIGKYFMNSPITSFQKIKGKNAASVVAVEAIIGTATSPTPSLDAVTISLPSCSNR